MTDVADNKRALEELDAELSATFSSSAAAPKRTKTAEDAEQLKFANKLKEIYDRINAKPLAERNCAYEDLMSWIDDNEDLLDDEDDTTEVVYRFTSYILMNLKASCTLDLMDDEKYSAEQAVVLALFFDPDYTPIPQESGDVLEGLLKNEIELAVVDGQRPSFLPKLNAHLRSIRLNDAEVDETTYESLATIFKSALHQLQVAYFPTIPITMEEAVQRSLEAVDPKHRRVFLVDEMTGTNEHYDVKYKVAVMAGTVFCHHPTFFSPTLISEPVRFCFNYLKNCFWLTARPSSEGIFYEDENGTAVNPDIVFESSDEEEDEDNSDADDEDSDEEHHETRDDDEGGDSDKENSQTRDND